MTYVPGNQVAVAVPVEDDVVGRRVEFQKPAGVVDTSGRASGRGGAADRADYGFGVVEVPVDLRYFWPGVKPVLINKLAAPLLQSVLFAYEFSNVRLGHELDLLYSCRRKPALDHFPGSCIAKERGSQLEECDMQSPLILHKHKHFT